MAGFIEIHVCSYMIGSGLVLLMTPRIRLRILRRPKLMKDFIPSVRLSRAHKHSRGFADCHARNRQQDHRHRHINAIAEHNALVV